MNSTITALSSTMRHIRDGLDVVAEDLLEMDRIITHPEGRKGYRTRSFSSDLGIPGHLKETISFSIPGGHDTSNIRVKHFLDKICVSITSDELHAIVKIPKDILIDQPDSLKYSLVGSPLSEIIDLSKTSIPEFGNSIINSIYSGNGKTDIYVKAETTQYQVKALVESYITRQK